VVTTWPWHWFSRGTTGAIGLIRLYQVEISANRPAVCRFTPSCSHYGIAALEEYGLVRGLWLIVRRLARCRSSIPWGTPDPVPRRSAPVH
jgi:putative membrane protein insertion efficiency factor